MKQTYQEIERDNFCPMHVQLAAFGRESRRGTRPDCILQDRRLIFGSYVMGVRTLSNLVVYQPYTCHHTLDYDHSMIWIPPLFVQGGLYRLHIDIAHHCMCMCHFPILLSPTIITLETTSHNLCSVLWYTLHPLVLTRPSYHPTR